MQHQEAEKEFERHIKANEPLLHKVCRMYADTHADRQDLFQEIVIQLWRAFPGYKGVSRFSTWLYRVAINTAISAARKQKDFITTYEPSALQALTPHDEIVEENDQVKEMYDAISQLNPIEKAIVMLYLEDRSYDEMEEVLGINQGNLRVKMTRIREKLRQITKQN